MACVGLMSIVVVYVFDLYSLNEDTVMVKVLKMLVVLGLFCSASQIMAEDALSTEVKQEAFSVVAQVEPQEKAVKVAKAEIAEEAVLGLDEEPVAVVADATVKSPVEDPVQVANIDEEILEAAEKVLSEDAATQVATVDKEYDLNFDDFEFDEEDGI